jgi:hypothetical protein
VRLDIRKMSEEEKSKAMKLFGERVDLTLSYLNK